MCATTAACTIAFDGTLSARITASWSPSVMVRNSSLLIDGASPSFMRSNSSRILISSRCPSAGMR